MVILKYYEWLKIQEFFVKKTGLKPDIREVVYELCTDNYKKIRKVSKEEALEMIKENNLKQTHRNKYGTIWR